MMNKLGLWIQCLVNESFGMFPTVWLLAASNRVVMDFIKTHFDMLKQKFKDYFEKNFDNFDWVHDPFLCYSKYFPMNIQEKLTDLKVDRTLILKLCKGPSDTFWLYEMNN